METAQSRNLKFLLDIIKEKLPSQPVAKLNREATITKSWKSIAELRQKSGYEKIIWQDESSNSKLDQKTIEKEFEERIQFATVEGAPKQQLPRSS